MKSLEEIQKALDLQTLQDKTPNLVQVLTELQGLKVSVVAGAVADTDIAVTGISTSDTIKAVIGIDTDAAAAADTVKDFTANVAVTAAGKVQADADLSAYRLIVVWYDAE